MTDPRDCIRATIRALNELAIPHMLTGSLASNSYGRPRSTRDADFVVAIGDKAIVANQLLTFTAVATDADQPAQTLAYSLGAGAPAGATINATTGVFSWTPTPAQAPGTYLITVRVSDGTAEDFEQITVFAQDVAATPVLPNLAAQTVDEGQTVALNLAAADTNLPHDRLTYAIVSGPAAATIDANGQFSWVTTEADGPGTHTFTIKVTDALGLSDTSTLTVTVNEVNQAPVLAPIGNRSVNEGELFSLIAVATDGDLPANTLTYSLANGVPAGVTIMPRPANSSGRRRKATAVKQSPSRCKCRTARCRPPRRLRSRSWK